MRRIAALVAILTVFAVSPAAADDVVRVSGDTPFPSGCPGGRFGKSAFPGAEQQPLLAANPVRPGNLLTVWWQDPAADFGAIALVAGVSEDGGATWTVVSVPGITRCAGDGVHFRILDASLSFDAGGTAYLSAYALRLGEGLARALESALVTHSADGGHSWAPATVITQQHGFVANGLGTLTGDPRRPGRAYFITHTGIRPARADLRRHRVVLEHGRRRTDVVGRRTGPRHARRSPCPREDRRGERREPRVGRLGAARGAAGAGTDADDANRWTTVPRGRCP
jgi:hypothetical protein